MRILVVNGKGGCGKTTIATNLATAYANWGRFVSLLDYDAQASSTEWWQQRPSHLPKIHLVEAHRRASMYSTRSFQVRLPAATDVVVVDTPSAVAERDLDDLLRGVQLVLMPLLPSPIDIRAGVNFIDQLMRHRHYRRKPMPVGIIANRVRPETLKSSKLHDVVTRLELPLVAAFQDSTVYTQLAENGCGLFDADTTDTGNEMPEWQRLLGWIDQSLADNGRARFEPLSVAQRTTDSRSIRA